MSESLLLGALLAVAGGFFDAYTYLCRGGVFANAQTGNIVLFGLELAQREWIRALGYLVPIVAFAVGVVVAEVVKHRYKVQQNRDINIHWRQIIVLAETVLVACMAFLPQERNTVVNSVISFVCALQVEAFRKIHGNAIATTMCIGNLRSGMEYLYRWHVTRDRAHLHRAKVYYLVILVFVLGAALGGVTCRSLGRLSILICCPLLLSAVAVMAWTKRSAEHGKKK